MLREGSVGARYYFSQSSADLEGGSSDVAVKLLGCVRVQLSQRRRKRL